MPVKAWSSGVMYVECPKRPIQDLFFDVDLRPGALNYAKPFPGWRFRTTDHGILIHEPDPSAAIS